MRDVTPSVYVFTSSVCVCVCVCVCILKVDVWPKLSVNFLPKFEPFSGKLNSIYPRFCVRWDTWPIKHIHQTQVILLSDGLRVWDTSGRGRRTMFGLSTYSLNNIPDYHDQKGSVLRAPQLSWGVEEPTKHRARAGVKAGKEEDGLLHMPETRRTRYAWYAKLLVDRETRHNFRYVPVTNLEPARLMLSHRPIFTLRATGPEKNKTIQTELQKSRRPLTTFA